MHDLLKLNWEAFNPRTGLNVLVSAFLVFGLMNLTGESWIATGMALLFAWLTNVPGSIRDRSSGMVAFAIGAIVITIASGSLGLGLWTNIVLLVVVGLIGTLALAHGIRAYMVGYALICWAIYGPFLIADTGVLNCILAIVTGTGAMLLVTFVGEKIGKTSETGGSDSNSASANNSASRPTPDYAPVLPYAITVAIVLGITAYLGWVMLKTDPLMIVGGAFFVIGFDERKTWIAGISRAVGVLAGIFLGLTLAQFITPGAASAAILIGAFFLCFAAGGIHPAAFMLFFMFIISFGWSSLDLETLNLTFWERLAGEGIGIVIAMLAVTLLQRLQVQES